MRNVPSQLTKSRLPNVLSYTLLRFCLIFGQPPGGSSIEHPHEKTPLPVDRTPSHGLFDWAPLMASVFLVVSCYNPESKGVPSNHDEPPLLKTNNLSGLVKKEEEKRRVPRRCAPPSRQAFVLFFARTQTLGFKPQ